MALRNFNTKNTLTSIAAANGTLTAAATTCVLNSTTSLPAVPFVGTFERGSATNEEVVLVTAVNTATNTITMVRGYDGTTGVSHNTGVSFEHTVSAIDFSEANAHVNATANVHGATGAVVDTGTNGQVIASTKTFDGQVSVGAATGSDLLLQNTTPSTSGAQVQAPGALRFAGHAWNGVGPNDMAQTASIVPTPHTGVGGSIELVYTALSGHTFAGVINANNGVIIPRGQSINTDGGTVNTMIGQESVAGGQFTGSLVSDKILKEPNGQRILIGTHGASGVQNPTLLISGSDVQINNNGTMQSLPRGWVGSSGLQNTSTTGITTVETTGAGVNATTFTAVAGRRYRIYYSVVVGSSVANDPMMLRIRDGGTSNPTNTSTVLVATVVAASPTANASVRVTGFTEVDCYPTGQAVSPPSQILEGRHTLGVFLSRNAGTGTLYIGSGTASVTSIVSVDDITS